MLALISLLYLGVYCFSSGSSSIQPTFKAAVYEMSPVLYPECITNVCTREKALEMMIKNVDLMRNISQQAQYNRADIIVFPEYCIGGDLLNRNCTEPFTQEVPPLLSNPCEQCRTTRMEVFKELSCIAKNANIYIVANLATRQICDYYHDDCINGWWFYNTNVAFTNKGDLIAVYHKNNLFGQEKQTFNRPSEPMVVTFNSEFGRIGLMTCFDVFFEEPGMSLLNQHVHTIAYPTYWLNASPLLIGIQPHSSWAYRHGVNYLASQTHASGQTGSGVYSTEGVKALYFEGVSRNQSRLMISELPMVPNKQNNVVYSKYANASSTPESPGVFPSEFDTDVFQFVVLGKQGTSKVCDGEFCCEISYRKDALTDETYALGAYSGLHHTEAFYMEVCALVKCAGTEHLSCGNPVKEATQRFSHVELSATFSTNIVYPSLLLNGKEEMDLAYDRILIREDGLFIYDAQPGDEGIIAAQLFGRPFFKDPKEVEVGSCPTT